MKLIHWPTFLRDRNDGRTKVVAVAKAAQDGAFIILSPGNLQEIDPEAGKETDAKGPIWPLEREWYPTEEKLSIPLVLSLVIGIHKASWWDTKKDRVWTCSKDDLTTSGKQLINTLEAIYGDITLLTFIENGERK